MGMVRHIMAAAIAMATLATSALHAQEVLLPLQSAPSLGMPAKSAGIAVKLPFFDDFSQPSPTLSPSLWDNCGTTAGLGYGELPPTIGMATLDALDADGNLYTNATTSPFPADTLLSLPIRLDSLTPADSLVLSFFYLPSGGSGNLWERIGDTPDPADSLYLDFYRPGDSTWQNVWARGGISVDTLIAHTGHAWQYVALSISDPAYFDSTFRFRFRNHCSLDAGTKRGMAGNCDQWNIDYILLDTARSSTAMLHPRDVAFVTPAPSLLSHYQAMPARQYRSGDMAQQLQLTIANLYNSELASHYQYDIISGDGDTVYSYDGGFENAPYDGYQTAAPHATPPVGYTFPESDTHSVYNIIHTVREGVGGDSHPQNDTIRFSQVFADYYAYDDGTAENGYGLTSTASHVYLAYRFDLNEEDTLTAVDLYFNRTKDGENESIMFLLTIWQADADGHPSTVLYRDSERRRPAIDGLNAYQRYVLENATVVNGSIFVGFEQIGNDFINLGFDRHTQSADRIWYLTSTAWQQSILRGSLMLRPLFGSAATVGIDDSQHSTLNTQHLIYPNPASTIVNISGLADGSTYNIYDIHGRLLLSGTGNSIDVSQLRDGFYIVRIANPDGSAHATKLIVKH